MVTYPSTHGVFEEGIKQHMPTLCTRTADNFTWDGANLNAQVGLCRPADIAPMSVT